MFAFQVTKEGKGSGSVVSHPVVIDGTLKVGVLWDEDYSFTEEPIVVLRAIPVGLVPEKPSAEVYSFPSAVNDEPDGTKH